MKKSMLLALGLFLCLVHVAGAVPHSSISSTIHTHHHLSTLSHILNQTTWLTELLEGRRAPQEITPGIRIDPTADPGLTVFAPTSSAFDAVAHLSHVDLLYHILPISLSLQPVNNYSTTYWVHSLSGRHGDAQFGVGQVLQVVVLPHRHAESSAYIIFGTPYSPHNIARVISSIPCSNGMLHIIDTVLSLPEMTSHVMRQLSESYQHRDNIEMLLKQREQYHKQEEKEKHNKKEKDGKDEQDAHHHDRVIRHGILKYDQVMKDYGFMRTVDRFRGITMFVPASTIESNLEHYSSNTLSVALLHHIIPGPPIYSFAALLDGAMTRTIILQGISGSTTLTIQRRSGFTPAMDTTDAITVMLNGHVVNPIPSITRNGVIYVVDSCLPDTQTTADSCTDIDPPIPAATVITVDSQSQHDMEERLREMRQQIHEREKEMEQREREMKHDFKEREHELLKQYQERQHERTRGYGEQQEQREQPQQSQQQYGDYTHYIPDYNKFIPGYQGKQQPTSEPSSPHIIHIGVGHDKDVSIVIGSDGLIITKEYKHGCEPEEDKECREKYDQEKEGCECESEDDKCRDECDAKAEEKEAEREKEREHAYEKEKEKEKEKERQHEKKREHDDHRERKDETEEKEREHEKEKECECQPSDDTCHDECDKKAHAHAHAHDDSGHERDEKEHEKEHDHDHDKHQDKKHECDKDECDEQEKSIHEKKHEKDQHGRDDKHSDKHHDKHDEKHDKHDTHNKHDQKHDNKHDIKSTSDAAVMQIAPELDPSVYDDDVNDHEEQSQQHHSWTQWTMILTIGILGGLVLVCAAAGYCCIHFQSRSDRPSAMGEYAAASETTGLLSKPVVPPVRDDVVSRPCCNDPTTNPTCHHDPNPIPVPPPHHKHLHLNGYQHSPNGCTHPILNDHHGISGSDAESERYMESHGTTSNGHIPNGHIKSNQGKSKGKEKGSGKSNGTNHENQRVPRSDAVNIHT